MHTKFFYTVSTVTMKYCNLQLIFVISYTKQIGMGTNISFARISFYIENSFHRSGFGRNIVGLGDKVKP